MHRRTITRREWLRSGLRWTVFSAIVGGATALIRRPGDCTIAPDCVSCGLKARCTRPRAIETRRIESHGTTARS